MASQRIDELVRMAETAFSADDDRGWSHGLLDHLGSVSREHWDAVPPGGSRSICSIALHAGATKAMYDDHAFGGGSLSWDHPSVAPWPDGQAPSADVGAWLSATHRRFVDHLAGLTDDDLELPRRANWGTYEPTRWLIVTVITHDMYHAGEINHLRSMLSGDDRWAFDRDA